MYCVVLRCVVLGCVVFCCVVLCRVVSCIVLCRMVWCGVVCFMRVSHVSVFVCVRIHLLVSVSLFVSPPVSVRLRAWSLVFSCACLLVCRSAYFVLAYFSVCDSFSHSESNIPPHDYGNA